MAAPLNGVFAHRLELGPPQLLYANAGGAQGGQGLGVAPQTGVEAGRIDCNDTEAPRAHRADEIGGAGRDDFDALGGQAADQLAGRTLAARPRARQQPPGGDALAGAGGLAVTAGDDEPHASGVGVRLRHEGLGRSQRELEARARSPADVGGRARVQDDGDLIGCGVVQLLHHQAAAVGRRGPVHSAQRLAGLVLAHAVQLVPATPQPPASEGGVAAAAEHLLGKLQRGGEHRQ